MKNADQQDLAPTQGIALQDIWLVAVKRKRTIITTALVALALAVLVSFLATPIYTAQGQILIEREPNILNFQDILQIESFNDDYYQTQYKILQSRAIAGETIDRLPLEQSKVFVKLAAEKGKARVEDLKSDPIARRQLITDFLNRLSIQPVRKTRLITASFSHPDPKFAAAALNALFEAYIEMSLAKKYQTSEQATDFLSKQISSVRSEIEANETKLQEYGKEKNIVAVSSSENTVIEKLAELNKALTDAQIDRVNKETYYNEIRLATADYIPDALSNPLIQRLREEYNRLYRDYVKKSETYLPDYPEIQSLKAELETAKKAMDEETQALIKRAQSDYQAALTKEQALVNVFNNQKKEAFQFNSNAILYNSLLIEIQNEKNLLDSLMKRKSEADLSSRMKGLKASNIWVIDKAEVPASPSSPKKAVNMALGLMLGLFGGLCLAFVRELFDVTVKDTEDIKKFSGLPILGLVPSFSADGQSKVYGDISEEKGETPKEAVKPIWTRILGQGLTTAGRRKPEPDWNGGESLDLVVHFRPSTSFSEHYRSIRTALLFSAADPKRQVLGVMSPMPQEGKTATTCNLAVALAQAGKRVLLIDADLRKPRLHQVFHVKNLNGFTKYLTADLALEDLLRPTPIQGLFLINAGPPPPNPLELLESDKPAKLIREVKEKFDFILVDTPPLLAVSDALVLGSQMDGAVLVVQWGKTPREALKAAREMMEAHKIEGLGIIVNNIEMPDFETYYRKSYYGHYRRT